MSVKIIVDSTADMTPEVASRVGIVPLTVHFGDEEYIDGVTIDKKAFYEKLIESAELPTTSQATPDTFMKEFEKDSQGFRLFLDCVDRGINIFDTILDYVDLKDRMKNPKQGGVTINNNYPSGK